MRGNPLGTGSIVDAHPTCRQVFEERSSTLMMASNVLFYSGLATLAAGAGMARCGFGQSADDVQLFCEDDRFWTVFF